VALLRSPELLQRVRALGDFLRFETCFPPHLSEFAILIVASHWRQSYEWEIHGPIALAAGVAATHLEALANGARPSGMSDEEATIYEFCKKVCSGATVGDHEYARMVVLFGERGTVEAAGLVGYYTLLAMVLNTARTPPPTVDERSSNVPRLPPERRG
jgi:4-carboxymuconolactone decarboxylase